MTLALPKEGLRNAGIERNVGELYLADISVPPELYARFLEIESPPSLRQRRHRPSWCRTTVFGSFPFSSSPSSDSSPSAEGAAAWRRRGSSGSATRKEPTRLRRLPSAERLDPPPQRSARVFGMLRVVEPFRPAGGRAPPLPPPPEGEESKLGRRMPMGRGRWRSRTCRRGREIRRGRPVPTFRRHRGGVRGRR